jgi:NAD(P)-dependent dehydrogenase (short-subunit alcohol dehydrogenase family)
MISMLQQKNELFSIQNKVIVITGAGGDIGSFLGTELTNLSARVYGIDIKFSKNNEIFKKIYCNITDQKKFSKICKQIFSNEGKIDVLINNAGITLSGKKNEPYHERNWQKTLDINLTAAFNCSQEVIKYMLKNKSGSIINMTSINAELAFPNNPAYVSSKGGLKMLSKALAKDWGKFGIRVNSIGPGYFITEMNKKSYENPEKRELRENKTMLGKWGKMDQLIGPILFLSSNASSYVTGQDIYIDGGWTANGLLPE